MAHPVALFEHALGKVRGRRPAPADTVQHPLSAARDCAEQAVGRERRESQEQEDHERSRAEPRGALESGIDVGEPEG